MIRVHDLTKNYKHKTAVNHLNLEVKENEAFALLGSNGAGKSTTIKIILGLTRADGGEVYVDPGKQVGYSPETPSFPGFLTGMEVLDYYAKLQKLDRDKRVKQVAELLDRVGLTNDRTRVKNYSKGMLQRLALAQALLGDPDILILDEPCAGLDAMGRLEMIGMIRSLKSQGKTILLNSHVLSDIEKVCDRGVIMNKGSVLREWNAGELSGSETLEQIFTQTIGGAR